MPLDSSELAAQAGALDTLDAAQGVDAAAVPPFEKSQPQGAREADVCGC